MGWWVLAAALASSAGEAQVPLSSTALARIDEAFESERARREIPGGALVVVQDGRIAHLRGFGVEDLETRRPVDPEATAFYLASVTKPFTATAVMQLVEQGKLDLDVDVNATLRRFKVPTTFPQAITLHHLLTHTAGFEDRTIGYLPRPGEKAVPLDRILARQLPARVFPPGRLASYSNYGYGLAGHLVEVASGQAFSDYLEDHVLAPLGMASSTAHIPPPDLATRVATSYVFDQRSGAMRPQPLGARNVLPAGSILATPRDVGRFVLAHLASGVVDGRRILRSESIERMHRRQFSHHPALPGVAYGFYERFYRGHRLLEHAGGVPGWATLLVLAPERGVGIFVASNQSTSAPNTAAVAALLGELYGPDPDAGAMAGPAVCGESTEPVAAGSLEPFVGVYHPTRASRHSIEKIAILDSQIQVAKGDDGFLQISNRRGQVTRWRRVGARLLAREGGSECLAFEADDRGRVRYLFGPVTGGAATTFPAAYERSAWLDRGDLQVPYMIGAMAILASAASLVPLVALARWLGRRRLHGTAAPLRRSRRTNAPWIVAGAAGALVTGFCIGLDGLLGNSGYRLQLAYGMTREMVALLWLPILFVALVPLLMHFAMAAWRDESWSPAARIYYSAVALTAASFVVFLINWRLLGFWYR